MNNLADVEQAAMLTWEEMKRQARS